MKWIAFMLTAFVAASASPALAQNYKVGSIEVGQPWVRATPGSATFTAGYFRITNSGTSADRLVGGSLDIASRFEIHEMAMEDNVMKMRPLANGLEIKAGATVELKPSSYHAMIMGLKTPLKQGQRIKGALVFENAGRLDIEYSVEGIGAQQPMAPGMGRMH